jgi:hypothetical protein
MSNPEIERAWQLASNYSEDAGIAMMLGNQPEVERLEELANYWACVALDGEKAGKLEKELPR